jgi:arginyl-tRNA synthetase
VTDRIRAALTRVAAELGVPDAEFVLERPRDNGHGDLATNLAMVLARPLRTNPRQLAERVVDSLALPVGVIERTEIAGPGFINFWLSSGQLNTDLQAILAAGPSYGRHTVGQGIRVNVEFVSANPTGPLHVGHGRGAALGDGIATLLEWTGHEAVREFYINDAGVQIDKLALSLWVRIQQAAGRQAGLPEGGYHGEYLADLAATVLAREGAPFADLPESEGVSRAREIALRAMREEQDEDLRVFGVRFDVHTSEVELYRSGSVEHGLDVLRGKGLTYESDGALWLRTTDFGDDKDRVLRKRDGTFTYLVPDVAYHVGKFERGFRHAIDVWGADHHGYVPRMRAVLRALGYPDDFFDAKIVQLVKVVRGGEEVRMSKRSGEFVTLRDLFEEVGVDAARYFFLMRRGESGLVFDVDLAKSQTEENPVFYVQMAHARMSGIFRVAGRRPEDAIGDVTPEALPAEQDQELLKKLGAFPEVVLRAAQEREPHRITSYLEELARVAHGWYHHCRVLGEPPAVEHGRLLLARAARQVLANGLTLLGCSAPDRM